VAAGSIEQAAKSSKLLVARALLDGKEEELAELLGDMEECGAKSIQGWMGENGSGVVLEYLKLKSSVSDVLTTEQARSGNTNELSMWSEAEVASLIDTAEWLTTLIAPKDPADFHLSYVEANCANDAEQQRLVMAAAFSELRSKIVSIKLLLTILQNEGDSSGIVEVDGTGDMSQRILQCLRAGGKVDVGGSLEDVQLKAFRGIASAMIESM
jgi:hypothetical protein